MGKKLSHPSQKIIDTFTMLKDGKSANFDKMVSRLGVKPVTAMVFICALRSDFGAEIETEREGRKVVSYKLLNADKVAPKMVLKTKASKVAKSAKPKVVATKTTKTVVSRKASKVDDGSTPTLDEDLSISEVSDAELADLRDQLGLS